MKRLILMAAAALALTACQKRATFTIEGTITGAEGELLCLRHLPLSSPAVVIDSVRLGADGRFAFTADAPEAPEFYILDCRRQFINLAIDSTETVTVSAALPTMAAGYSVAGSDDCEKIRELSLKLMQLDGAVRALDGDRRLSPEQKGDSLAALVDRYKEDIRANYIYHAPASAYAYFALFQRLLGQYPLFDPADRQDLKAFGAVATSWDAYYPEALRTENLRNITLRSMDDNRLIDARRQQAVDESKVVEAGVIDLELPDATGQLRTLTALRGQVVLLDFHSFTARESAERILLLRELYNKYHDRGLEIYQVAVGDEQHLWRQATDALPWVSVYDPEGASLMRYNVQQLPEFFLISRDNVLQKRSSQMTDLEAEIRALL